MDRTNILHGSMNHLNKKCTESSKLTESFLCDEIYDNLRTLALIHPFSEEFKEIFEKVHDLSSLINTINLFYFIKNTFFFCRECL